MVTLMYCDVTKRLVEGTKNVYIYSNLKLVSIVTKLATESIISTMLLE